MGPGHKIEIKYSQKQIKQLNLFNEKKSTRIQTDFDGVIQSIRLYFDRMWTYRIRIEINWPSALRRGARSADWLPEKSNIYMFD